MVGLRSELTRKNIKSRILFTASIFRAVIVPHPAPAADASTKRARLWDLRRISGISLKAGSLARDVWKRTKMCGVPVGFPQWKRRDRDEIMWISG